VPALFRAIRQHNLLEFGCKLFPQYGNTFTISELGRRFIVTIEPENIKTILSLQFKDYAVGYRLESFRPLLSESMFDTDGEAWARSRALIRPSFVRDQIADLNALEVLFQDLFVLLPQDGETVVDLQSLFFRYTLDSATEFLFGHSAGTLRGERLGSQLEAAFESARQATLMRGTLGRLKAFYPDPKGDEAIRTCREFANQYVDEAVRTAEKAKQITETPSSAKRIFSHELAARTDDRKVILDEAMSLLLAGRDTTASLLGNMFFMLAKNPAIWERLRDEVAFLNGRPPSYEELRQIKYVQHCVSECE
jgi:cytochrome P450